MTWYFYKRGGWEIAVDAVSVQDARQLINRQAPTARYLGHWNPSTMPSTKTAMTTVKRQEQISAKVRRETQS